MNALRVCTALNCTCNLLPSGQLKEFTPQPPIWFIPGLTLSEVGRPLGENGGLQNVTKWKQSPTSRFCRYVIHYSCSLTKHWGMIPRLKALRRLETTRCCRRIPSADSARTQWTHKLMAAEMAPWTKCTNHKGCVVHVVDTLASTIRPQYIISPIILVAHTSAHTEFPKKFTAPSGCHTSPSVVHHLDLPSFLQHTNIEFIHYCDKETRHASIVTHAEN